MAESAAHFTATSHPKPSIFEIIAQNSLNSTIHPALQKITLFLSTYNPKKFGWLTEYSEEVFLAVNGIIQYHYIKKYGASFAEHFYGLKRVPVFEKVNDNITFRQKKLSLVFLVLLPYLKIKFEEKLAIYRMELADGVLLNNWKRKLKRLLCSLQSIFHLSWTFWIVSYYLRYMSGSTDVQSPVLKFLALKLTYADPVEDNNRFWSALFRGQLSLMQLSTGLLQQIKSNSLELAAFFVQFLQAWKQENSHVDITALPAPDPPQYDPKSADYKKKCPICMQKWKVPTVVPVSGYVFCFRCIIKHLQEKNSCPVTNFPASLGDLVRLYD